MIWVYCLLRASRKPALPRVKQTPPDCGPPRLLDAAEGLWLLVSDARGPGFAEAAVNARLTDLDWVSACALGHQAVVAQARSRAKAVVPLQLFTLFRNEARAQAFVDKERGRLRRALDRVEGCAEYGVRLTLDPGKARERAAVVANQTVKGQGGAAFLQRKSAIKQAATQLEQTGQQAAAALYGALAALAEEGRRRAEVEGLSESGRLLLDGVFLVKEARGARFKTKAQTAGRALEQEGYSVSVSGPWPPYHFVVDSE